MSTLKKIREMPPRTNSQNFRSFNGIRTSFPRRTELPSRTGLLLRSSSILPQASAPQIQAPASGLLQRTAGLVSQQEEWKEIAWRITGAQNCLAATENSGNPAEFARSVRTLISVHLTKILEDPSFSDNFDSLTRLPEREKLARQAAFFAEASSCLIPLRKKLDSIIRALWTSRHATGTDNVGGLKDIKELGRAIADAQASILDLLELFSLVSPVDRSRYELMAGFMRLGFVPNGDINPERLFTQAVNFWTNPNPLEIYNKELLLRAARSFLSSPLATEPEAGTGGEEDLLAMDGRRDDILDLHCGQNWESPLSLSRPWERGLKRARILLENGRAFLKPAQGACAAGVCELAVRNGAVLIRSQDENILTRIETFDPDHDSYTARIPGTDEYEEREKNDLFEFARCGNGFTVRAKDGHDIANEEDLARLFEYLEIKYGSDMGSTILEAAINTPAINGDSVWEIRTINQRLGGNCHHASYAKVGASDFIANISTGGGGMLSSEAIGAAYDALLPGLTAQEKQKRVQEFLSQCYLFSEIIADGLTELFAKIRDRYVPDYPLAEIRPSDFSVDYMGMIDGDVLRPCPVDINFFYGMSGLKEVDPVEYGKVAARQKAIKKEMIESLCPPNLAAASAEKPVVRHLDRISIEEILRKKAKTAGEDKIYPLIIDLTEKVAGRLNLGENDIWDVYYNIYGNNTGEASAIAAGKMREVCPEKLDDDSSCELADECDKLALNLQDHRIRDRILELGFSEQEASALAEAFISAYHKALEEMAGEYPNYVPGTFFGWD